MLKVKGGMGKRGCERERKGGKGGQCLEGWRRGFRVWSGGAEGKIEEERASGGDDSVLREGN
eukprot:330532-Rhodomonas_salina.3